MQQILLVQDSRSHLRRPRGFALRRNIDEVYFTTLRDIADECRLRCHVIVVGVSSLDLEASANLLLIE